MQKKGLIEKEKTPYTFDERENTFSVLKVLFFSAQVLFLSVKILFLSVDFWRRQF
jgi:hypothetical protein